MISKSHIARIEQMIRRAEDYEARMQKVWGDRKAGTGRSSDARDTAALKALLAAVLQKEPA